MKIKTLEQKTAQGFAGLQINLLSKLRSGTITFEQVIWFNNLSFVEREALMGKQPEVVPCLSLLSGPETLMLDALDGQETLATAKDVFRIGFDKYFDTNKVGIATKAIAVDVYEIIKDTTYAQTFGSLGIDLDKLCLTQAQIKNFCKKYPNWLQQNDCANLFLFKVEDEFFVVRVNAYSDYMHFHIDLFRYKTIFRYYRHRREGYSPRLIVPQLDI